jgi:acetyl-CoA C-acetyltransferase
MTHAYIVAAARTAGGRRNGRLKDWHPADLGGALLDGLLDRVDVDPASVEDVIFGCVQQAGEQSQNVARTVALSSRLPETVPGTTIDRACGSSQQALHFAAAVVASGSMDIVIAGGVESMTRVPMLIASTLPEKNGLGIYRGSRFQKRFPGAEPSQFTGAEMMASKYGLTKDELDLFSFESHAKAAQAASSGAFDAEIVPIAITTPEGTQELHKVDEGIRFGASLEAMKNVKLLQEGGVVTAAAASQICDGASAMLVVNDRGLKRLGVKPLARVHHMSVLGGDPVIMLETPIAATQRALKSAGLTLDEIDLFEVNEAFASVPVAWLKETGADPARLNVNGGAIALGHPLGSSGTRLMATLIHALGARNKRYGLQTMCESGGLANVTIIERL